MSEAEESARELCCPSCGSRPFMGFIMPGTKSWICGSVDGEEGFLQGTQCYMHDEIKLGMSVFYGMKSS